MDLLGKASKAFPELPGGIIDGMKLKKEHMFTPKGHLVDDRKLTYLLMNKVISQDEILGHTQRIKLNGRKMTIRYLTKDEIIPEGAYMKVGVHSRWVRSNSVGDFVSDHTKDISRLYMVPINAMHTVKF